MLGLPDKASTASTGVANGVDCGVKSVGVDQQGQVGGVISTRSDVVGLVVGG